MSKHTEKKDLQKLALHPFVRFTKEERERADKFLRHLQTEAEKEEKKAKEKQEDGPLLKKKSDKRKKLKIGDQEQTVFICDYCQKEFSYSSHLKMHLTCHTGQKDYHCHLCDFSASQKGNLDDHIRRHLNEKNFKCPEINCGATFVSSAELKQHQANHKKRNKIFLCSSCSFKTHSQALLAQHEKNIHSESTSKSTNKYLCHLCDFSASQKGNLKVHIRRRHLKEKNFKCPGPNCGASFVSFGELKQHQIVHNKNNKKFVCSICRYKTNYKGLLIQHLKNVHSASRPFKCPHENCEYSAKQKGILKQHLKIHSLEKDQVCPHQNCGFQTKTSQALKSHMKTHSNGEKRYKCHFCDFSSHQHGGLIVHVRVHTGETPFACQLCSYKTKDQGNLNKHMKKHAD